MKKKFLAILLSLSMLLGLLPTVALAAAPSGYTTDSNGIMAYKEIPDSAYKPCFDIKGCYGTDWLATTYNNSGYFIRYEGLSDASVTPKAEFTNEGRYVKVTYTVTAGSSAISGGKLAIVADIQIGLNDSAAVSVIQNASGKVIGLKMINDTGTFGNGAQFNLYFDGTGGVTPADRYWFGYQQKRGTHLYDQLTGSTVSADGMSSNYTKSGDVYTSFSGKDSAATFSWNVDLAAGESKAFSFLVGVGKKADPPVLAGDAPISLTANSGRTVDVAANVTDASGLTDTLYYNVDGSGEQTVGSVTADGTAKDITGQISLSGLADGAHTLAFWVVNSSGALSPSVTREVTVTASGVEGLDTPPAPAEAKWGTDAEHLTGDGTLVEALTAAKDSGAAYIQLQGDVTAADKTYFRAEGGTFTLDLNGNTLTGGKGTDDSTPSVAEGGTGLTISGANVTLKNGTVTGGTGGYSDLDNDMNGNGGRAVCVSSGSLTVERGVTLVVGDPGTGRNGTPSGNVALEVRDGAVTLNGGTFSSDAKMEGGVTKQGVGYAISVGSGQATLTVPAGAPVTATGKRGITITGCREVTIAAGCYTGTEYGMYLNTSGTVKLSGGTFSGTGNQAVAGKYDTLALLADGCCFSADGTTKVEDQLSREKTLHVIAAPAHTHAMSVDCSTSEGTQVAFTAWTDATAMPTTAGNWYLDTDVTLTDATWTVPSGETNLCLNGHIIKYQENRNEYSVVTVPNGATLNLCDCDNTTKRYGNWSKGRVEDGGGTYSLSNTSSEGAIEFTGGVIAGGLGTEKTINGWNKVWGGGVYVEGNFNLHGGNIAGNNTVSTSRGAHGTGVAVVNRGMMTMTGGRIADNLHDGGVGVYHGGTFTMSGGHIDHNYNFGGDGGGVDLSAVGTTSTGGRMTMTGGSIHDNGSRASGGGVNISQASEFTMTGGSITHNQVMSNRWGGGVCAESISKSFTLSGNADISGNTVAGSDTPNDIALMGRDAPVKITVGSDLTIPAGKVIYVMCQDTATGDITTGGYGKNHLSQFAAHTEGKEIVANGNELAIQAKAVAPTITTATLPAGERGSRYSQTLAATGDTPITWSVTQGQLPDGLTLNADTGLISGTPTTAGTSTFTVSATNTAGTSTKELSITVKIPFSITTASLPNGTVGTAYSAQMECEGAPDPENVRWSIATEFGADKVLPDGLTISTTGLISGTPTKAGSFSFYPKASSGSTSSSGKQYTIIVSEEAPAHTHTMQTGDNWTSDGTNHWHQCTASDCPDVTGSKTDVTAHTKTWDADGSQHWQTCSVCGWADSTKAAHVYDDDADITCNICGYTRTVTPPAPVTPHTCTGTGTRVTFNKTLTADTRTISESGNYYLSADVNMGENKITIGDGVSVKLCLNGHTLNYTKIHGNAIEVSKGGTLELCDCGTDGKISSGGESAIFVEGGTLTMYGGRAEGTGGYGIFMGWYSDADTEDEEDPDAMVAPTVTINGGSIAGAEGGIAVMGGKLTVNGGTVRADYGSASGEEDVLAGIYALPDELTINGGAISGKDYGLYLIPNGKTTLSGGTFSGQLGSAIYIVDGIEIGDTPTTYADLLAPGYVYQTVSGGETVPADNKTAIEAENQLKVVRGSSQPTHTHSWATAWAKNDTHHWHECTPGCPITDNAQKDGYGAHTWNAGEVTTAPTATAEGVKTYTCTICSATKTEAIPVLTFDVSGAVTDSGSNAVVGATVKLMQGKNEIASTTTDTNGDYRFTGVGAGSYNVVATKDGKTMTILVTITNANQTDQNLQMPSDDVNSVLEVKGDNTPAVVVGGLEKEAEANKADGSTVTVTMTVEGKAENAAANANEIKTVAGAGKTLEYLEIKVEKKVEAEGSTTTDTISTTSDLLTIIIPFNFTGKDKASVTVYRYHGDSVDTLTTTANGAGERIVLGADSITLQVKNFSTYAIGYTETASEPTPNPPTGGSYPSGYSPDIQQPDHGKITVSPARPKAGDTVTITVSPEDGYGVEDVTVTDKNGKAVEVMRNPDGTYTFKQPSGKVTISAALKEICPRDDTCPIAAFNDASTTAWYHDGIHYCIANGLMVGTSKTAFAPELETSRAMIATILWRLAGSPDTDQASVFNDVADNAWYAKAVTWAAGNGIVAGYGNSKFGPNDPITREQLAAMLWRYAEKPAAEGNLSNFTDQTKVNTWAVDALRWAVEQGIVAGKGGGILDPRGKATRAEAAAMIQRYCLQAER